ncbi:anaphase-promoting complex subunit Cdc27p [[Candida] jaroonii]|uniref:Anaphase-promoting complex subunit Cdc27p n=1 Tax=[Candida] jaroonii TaxID=467808 RepID=A0ACA9YC64_9ASCO|nr:anaphase-promoting complex subunit Cdc27p [[Candida] jaroonii]
MEFVIQQLRSVIIHSIDTFNYSNAEFAGERLLALDNSSHSIYLYAIVLFHQGKHKTVYSKLLDIVDHLGCAYLFAKSCLQLGKYKEGIYQILKQGNLDDETFFNKPEMRFSYENNRSMTPDASAVYHLLGDLFNKVGDVKNASLNYSSALKCNQFDFEAFTKLCKLGVEVKVKNLYKQDVVDEFLPTSPNTILPPNHLNTPINIHVNTPLPSHVGSPFNEDISTPRIKSTTVPMAPKREFIKPKTSYSKVTSRLINPPKKPELKFTTNKDIENSNNYLIQLYIVFAKAYKCFSKYDCYKAIRILESLPDNEKETPWVLSKLGRLHYEIVNYKQSEYFYNKLRLIDRTRLNDMEYYSTLLWHLHKKIELTYLCNELYDLDNTSPITWCVLGNLFSLNREPDEAIKCFNKSIKLDKNFTYAYTLKGHEYFSNDNYEMALENFRTSLIIDNRHYNALYGIGMVYINLGDYEKADYHFKKAVSINPINVILICCVGMVLEKLGKKNLALRQYELANKLQPLNPLPIFKKAQLLFTMQQFQQSLQLFEILKDLAPDEASVHFLLGQLYHLQDDKFSAIREFTIALNLDPKGNYLIREAMEALQEK